MNTSGYRYRQRSARAVKGKGKQVALPRRPPHRQPKPHRLRIKQLLCSDTIRRTFHLNPPTNPAPVSSNEHALVPTQIATEPLRNRIDHRPYLPRCQGRSRSRTPLRDVQVGDVSRSRQVHEIGSRDYTLRAQDTLNTRRISSAVDLSSRSSARPLRRPQRRCTVCLPRSASGETTFHSSCSRRC